MSNKLSNIVYNQNIIQDKQLLKLIINHFDNYNIDIDIFKLNFYILTKYITNIEHNNFIINLNIIYKFLGFYNIFFAKLYLFKKFIYNKDFIINFKKNINEDKYICSIYLTIDCYKRYCIHMNNKKSLELYENYINLEFLYNKFTEQKFKKLTYNKSIKHNDDNILDDIFDESIKHNDDIFDELDESIKHDDNNDILDKLDKSINQDDNNILDNNILDESIKQDNDIILDDNTITNNICNICNICKFN